MTPGRASAGILDAYLAREILLPFTAALAFLTLLLVATRAVDRADVLLGAGASLGDVGAIVACLVPTILAHVVPIAFLLGTVLGVARLASDRELVALSAVGISPGRLLRVPFALALVVAAAALWMAFDVEPAALQAAGARLSDVVKRSVAREVRAGTFYDRIPDHVVYAERASGGLWEHVLVFDGAAPGSAPVLALARRGRMEPGGAGQDARLVLEHGEAHRYGEDGELTVLEFGRGEITIGLGAPMSGRASLSSGREHGLRDYVERVEGSRRRGDEAGARRWEGHLHRKIASALALLPFALLAVPLGAWHAAGPGFGATAALLLVVLQYLLLRGGEVLVQRGVVPAALGLEAGNLLLAAAGLGLTAALARRGAGAVR